MKKHIRSTGNNVVRMAFLPLLMSAVLSIAQPPSAPVSEDQKLSIDVKDTDIRDVIRMISKGYDINILLDQDIKGKVTLHLVDVPIMEGLRSIAALNNLEVIQDGSVYNIRKAAVEQKSLIRYSNGKLTVDVQNVDVRDFLKELSSKTAVSIVPDTKVEGTISGKLFLVDFDDGLRALLEGNGFSVLKRRNIYQVSQSSSTGNGEGGPASRLRKRGSSNDLYVDYSNGLLSVDVVNGDLEEIIRAIAEQSEAEIITYGSIKSEINAKLNDVPLTEGLALLLGGTRFTFVQKDNVILIGDRNTATPSGIALSKSELIHLKHIKADNIPSILPKDIPATNVRVIKEQNALLISGTSEDIVSAIEFLKTIDIPTPQVRIDAVIVEFKENLDKEFGLRGGMDWRLSDSSYMITPFPKTLHSSSSQNFEVGLSGKFLKNAVKKLFGGNGPSILKNIPDDFFSILRFLETQDKAKVLAQPSILTLNGNKASIDVSETQYFKVETGVGENHTSRFQPIKFGIQLDIVPWISQSGQITAEITPNVSNSEKTNNEGYPNVSTRSINTTVRLNDGQTLILGGLIKNQETTYSYKIPFLGDLPILGVLFRHSGKTRSKSNLIVFITPHIVLGNSEVDLDQELEKFKIHDMNIIEKSIHDGVKRIRSRRKKDDSLSAHATGIRESDSVALQHRLHSSTPSESEATGRDSSTAPVEKKSSISAKPVLRHKAPPRHRPVRRSPPEQQPSSGSADTTQQRTMFPADSLHHSSGDSTVAP
ncbi:MAG: type II secretion system protein GspD [Chitinispirillaceae bacterium]|nr:type II secretion system protein GspD [Chitinispirillaceae bacterium]